jgi:tRNA(Ile)-lysidine synthase
MRPAAAQNRGPTPLPKFRPPKPGRKILVAVSGGLDSMVLLHMLQKLSADHRWNLTVAHFNHCLRGRASDADEAFVRKTAAAIKLPFVAGRADVKKFAKESKLSIEMAARKLRHEFFAETARQLKIAIVALAHHADDQVELFFLRLLRGAGGSLAGMKWKSSSPAGRKISLVRPLLDFSKAELKQLAKENKIRYREDASNLSSDFLRNRIRHELLPLLRKYYQPALNKTVLRLMEIVASESEFACEAAQAWLRGKQSSNFEKSPVAVQRQVLRLQLAALGVAADFNLIESLRKNAKHPVAVFANVFVLCDENGRVRARENQAPQFNDRQQIVKLDEPCGAVFDGIRLKWQFKPQPNGKFTPPARKAGAECFDADKIGGEIVLRHWRAGDRFQPIGLKAPAKLQDLFVNKKIPRGRRHRLVVAESGGEIFWVEALRISENFKLTPRTKRLLIWQWRR